MAASSLYDWLEGFHDTEKSVRATMATIVNHPLMLDVQFPEEKESDEEDVMRLSFNDDIYDWFAPHIEEAIKLQDKTMRRDFEHFFWGCLTLYGVLTEKEFFGLIEQHYEGMLAAPFYANLHRFAALDYCFEFHDGRSYLCHPAVQDDLLRILEDRKKRGQDKATLRKHSLDDILTAGATAPYSCCHVNTQEGKNLFQQLLKAGYDNHQAPLVMADFWLEKQLPGIYGSSLNQMASNLLNGGHFRKESEAHALLDALMEYCNNVPLWIFKGRSSHEMFQKDPHKDEKMATAGAMMSQMQRHLQDASAFPKVGRNDPCPCGSGLKYKNCHGKNLN